MANLSQFVFFDSASTELESNVFGNANQSSAITLQINADGAGTIDNLTVYGAVDMKEPDAWFPLKAILLKNFRTYETISTEGIFLILTDGIAYIKLVREDTTVPIKAFGVGLS